MIQGFLISLVGLALKELASSAVKKIGELIGQRVGEAIGRRIVGIGEKRPGIYGTIETRYPTLDGFGKPWIVLSLYNNCLLYTSPSPRDRG